MAQSPIQALAEFGQSVWLDYISCSLIESGKLRSLIGQGLRGLTSNPSIFNQVISAGHDYDSQIFKLARSGRSTREIYDALSIADIQAAADAFAGVYEATGKLDGYVSLEIDPQLADKFEDSLEEGVRLHQKVDRKNLMIKVPATEQGYPVIEALTAQGINVNATLIFSVEQYEKTVEAYCNGLARLAQTRQDLGSVRSVASVFVSRIDSVIDQMIDGKIQTETNALKKKNLASLKGKAAVANCLRIFKRYQELFITERFKTLQTKNANIQRVLWASTSTKNPDYSDIKYVSELIAENTVNTIPEKTLSAFMDHGQVKKGFELHDIPDAVTSLSHLKSYGIDIEEVCQKLLKDGVLAFASAFGSLFSSIDEKLKELSAK